MVDWIGALPTTRVSSNRVLLILLAGAEHLLGDGVRFDDLLPGMDVASVATQVMFVGEFTESARLARWVVDAFPADDRRVAGLRVRCLGTAAVAELLRGLDSSICHPASATKLIASTVSWKSPSFGSHRPS